jgi:16S rRNA (guanine527-N7)-methyltransferase
MDIKSLLSEGIEVLCKNDSEIEHLIAHDKRKDEIILFLDRYIKEIELFNPAYGLVGTSDIKELVIKHIFDSLAPLGIISRILSSPCAAIHKITFQIADAGSGAGLPGIPLAIALPYLPDGRLCNFTLIERMGRRAGFLMNTKAVLALNNIAIEENEIEKTAPCQFDLITFRAFKPLDPKLLKTLFNTCKPNGVIAAYKGRHEKIKEEMEQFQKTEYEWEVIPCQTPFLDEERHLLVIKKITPSC